ncbi:MAG: translation initiation factor IF-2, partial [Terriglobales bacterium]
MEKVRINDLARELEVKSKEVLDLLPTIGVTEKKTHSSSIEPGEAEKVREHFRVQADAAQEAASRAARSSARPLPGEIKTKIDLTGISKPGDVLKAISRQSVHAEAAPAAPAAKPVVKPAATAAPAKPAVPTTPGTPAAPAARAAAAPAVPGAPIARRPIAPPAAPTATATAAPAAHPPAKAPTPPPAAGAPTGAPPAATASSAPSAPPRRLITPQTGPRPVYQAPIRLQSSTPVSSGPAAAGERPAPGRPVRGQPIFQRPRPQASARPPLRPGERRPMHPTRLSPTGTRPPGASPVGAGAAPAGRPGRPGAPARRPGQRYVPRGVKEGPMKGFKPPPRLASLSAEPLPITRSITITEGISVKDLAEKLDIRAKDLIHRLLARGVFATINQTLDAELANEMARQFGAETSVISFEEQAAQEFTETTAIADQADQLRPRPPVVTVMGHVDHGKTSLLDAIRATSVAAGEAGGITQHIGAYKVAIQETESPAYGREIVFLDTPGHEAFTRMRARGAKVTDIVVLVVAADDGVMPQTVEAIDHAQAAKVPIIVAVNKIDKPEAMPERVKKQLADRGLMPEDWGGKTVFVDVSAKKKTNLNLLMEMICLVADLADLKANPDRPATGSVLEAKLDRGRGAVSTVLVQNGTLRVQDTFIVGNVFGKVRAMFDDRGAVLTVAPPSTPVEILGLEGLPQAGDQFTAVPDRARAKQIALYREQKAREALLAKTSRVSLEGLAEQVKAAGMKELPMILKGDVQGSVEVLADSLSKLSTDKVKVKILRTGVG